VKNFVTLALGLLLCGLLSSAHAAPSEVLSEIAYIKKGGIDAVRLDFAVPVRYISHAPTKHGSSLTIKISFDRSQALDTSELPLMQSLFGPEGGPLTEVIYETVGGEPRLQLKFKREVDFSVSQILGPTSLVVFLPDDTPTSTPIPPPAPTTVTTAKVHKATPPELAKSEQSTPDTQTDVQAKKQLDDGHRALRNKQYKKAIQIFSGILSMPPNKYSQPALELLGVARERNNQAAHAKAIYEQYLDQYAEVEDAGEDLVRVRQRLADLLAAQLKPQKKLKESPRQKREGDKKISSTLDGNLSQYFFYTDIEAESIGREVQYRSVDTQLSLSWRIRSEDWEIYNHYFGDLEYDTLENDAQDVETSSAYSRIKNRKAGFYATLGRQRSSVAGPLGRFDGVYLGYDIMPKVRLNGLWGYPVDIQNKRIVQTDKPMIGAGLDFLDILKGLDISPYYIQQQVDGITDRQAVGMEARYFQPKFSLFSRLDYDIAFSDVNLFFLQSQYIISKPTSILLLYDFRKNPFLETSNALINLGEDISIKDLIDGTQSRSYSEAELQEIAKDRTGAFSVLTLQLNHAFNVRQQMTLGISRAEQSVKVVNLTVNNPTVDEVLETPATEDKDVQYDATLQLVSSQIFQTKDAFINFLRYTYDDSYDEAYYRVEYRIPYRSLIIAEPRFRVRYRANATNVNTYTYVPGIRVQYRAGKALRFYLEYNYEIWNFSGDTVQEDYQSTNFYLGYNWLF
jgi:hypothetical protein